MLKEEYKTTITPDFTFFDKTCNHPVWAFFLPETHFNKMSTWIFITVEHEYYVAKLVRECIHEEILNCSNLTFDTFQPFNNTILRFPENKKEAENLIRSCIMMSRGSDGSSEDICRCFNMVDFT